MYTARMVFEICMANDERQFVSWNYIPVITVTIFSECQRPSVNATDLRYWKVNIVSGHELMPSGNKLLPETMLSQVSRDDR